MKVAAGRATGLLAAAAQQLGEEVVALLIIRVAPCILIGARPGAAGIFAVVAGVPGRLFGPGGVDLARVVASPLLDVRQEVVGDGNFLEPLFGGLVAGVQVGVEFFASCR